MAMLPYFIFDIYYWQQNVLTTFGALGDGVGNAIFGICAYLGYKYGGTAAIQESEDGNVDDHEE
jgi:hypothetical protein